MTVTASTNERQARFRARQKAKGLLHLNEWVTPGEAKAIRRLLAIRKGTGAHGTGIPNSSIDPGEGATQVSALLIPVEQIEALLSPSSTRFSWQSNAEYVLEDLARNFSDWSVRPDLPRSLREAATQISSLLALVSDKLSGSTDCEDIEGLANGIAGFAEDHASQSETKVLATAEGIIRSNGTTDGLCSIAILIRDLSECEDIPMKARLSLEATATALGSGDGSSDLP